MKTMILIRQLLYKEKTLDDFDIESDSSIFKLFFELLLKMDGTKVTDLDVERNITRMLNDACYICTIALIIKRPALKLGYFRELCNQKTLQGTYYSTNEARADVVMCMVYILLKHCSESNNNIKNLTTVIDTNLRERSKDSWVRYDLFTSACFQYKDCLPPGFFAPIIITKEVIDNLLINWKEVTDGFNEKVLRELLGFWGDPKQRNLIIDAIEKDVNSMIFDDDLPF